MKELGELPPEDETIVQKAVDSLRRSLVNQRLNDTSTEVQEALEDLWYHIGDRAQQLQPETIQIAVANHERLRRRR